MRACFFTFPTTSTGEVRPVRKPAHTRHPHHTRLWGVGVRCGYKKLNIAGGENSCPAGRPRLKIQAGCRPTIGGAP